MTLSNTYVNSTQSNIFGIAPLSLWRASDNDIADNIFRLYGLMRIYAGNRGFIWYSQAQLAKDSNKGKRQIANLLKKLEEYGYITQMRRGLNKTNCIFILDERGRIAVNYEACGDLPDMQLIASFERKFNAALEVQNSATLEVQQSANKLDSIELDSKECVCETTSENLENSEQTQLSLYMSTNISQEAQPIAATSVVTATEPQIPTATEDRKTDEAPSVTLPKVSTNIVTDTPESWLMQLGMSHDTAIGLVTKAYENKRDDGWIRAWCDAPKQLTWVIDKGAYVRSQIWEDNEPPRPIQKKPEVLDPPAPIVVSDNQKQQGRAAPSGGINFGKWSKLFGSGSNNQSATTDATNTPAPPSDSSSNSEPAFKVPGWLRIEVEKLAKAKNSYAAFRIMRIEGHTLEIAFVGNYSPSNKTLRDWQGRLSYHGIEKIKVLD